MIKLRIEGTEKEINSFLLKLDRVAAGKIKPVSKFYPNRIDPNLAQIMDKNILGRVYVEVE